MEFMCYYVTIYLNEYNVDINQIGRRFFCETLNGENIAHCFD
jgi:hypothetical protein